MMRRMLRTVAVERPAILTTILALVLWQAVAAILQPRWLPTLNAIAVEFWGLLSEGAFSVLGTSARTLAVGLLVVFLIAGVLAILMRVSRAFDEAIAPLLNVAMAVPQVALIPVFIFIWGLSETTLIVAIVAFAVFPVVLNWATALKGVPPELEEMSRSFGSTAAQRLRTVMLPSSASLMLLGVRLAVVQGVKGIVTAEIVIGTIGIGRLVTQASQTFNIPELYAVILTILAVSVIAYALLSRAEERVSAWNG